MTYFQVQQYRDINETLYNIFIISFQLILIVFFL